MNLKIHILNNRGKLINETPELLNTFRDLHYNAGMILIDRDKIGKNGMSCVSPVIDLFDNDIQEEARKPIDDRYLFICIAISRPRTP